MTHTLRITITDHHPGDLPEMVQAVEVRCGRTRPSIERALREALPCESREFAVDIARLAAVTIACGEASGHDHPRAQRARLEWDGGSVVVEVS